MKKKRKFYMVFIDLEKAYECDQRNSKVCVNEKRSLKNV